MVFLGYRLLLAIWWCWWWVCDGLNFKNKDMLSDVFFIFDPLHRDHGYWPYVSTSVDRVDHLELDTYTGQNLLFLQIWLLRYSLSQSQSWKPGRSAEIYGSYSYYRKAILRVFRAWSQKLTTTATTQCKINLTFQSQKPPLGHFYDGPDGPTKFRWKRSKIKGTYTSDWGMAQNGQKQGWAPKNDP